MARYLKSLSRIGKSAAFRRIKVPRKGRMHIDWPRSQQQGFCFPTVRALAKDGAAEDADLRSKSLSALVADCAPSGASTETAGFSRWSVHYDKCESWGSLLRICMGAVRIFITVVFWLWRFGF